MNPDPNNPKRKPLVTVEFQTEVDVATGNRDKRMFVKMYFEARDSGLLGVLPDELWKTLCVLATYMDENGNCYPSQAELARHLDIRREAVNARIQRLLDFRFKGEPVLSVHRIPGTRGRWGKNHYTIHPISSFAIFDQPKPLKETEKCTMCGQPHMDGSTMCAPANMVRPHTNQNQTYNQTNTHSVGPDTPKEGNTEAVALVAYFHEKAGHPRAQAPTSKELEQAAKLVSTHGKEKSLRIVSFALERHAETNFRARHFGSVLSYVSDALATLERETARARREDEDRRRRAEEAAALEAERREWAALPVDERVNRRTARRVEFFRIMHKREPTDEEIDTFLDEAEQQESA